jgi:hypothetical protein
MYVGFGLVYGSEVLGFLVLPLAGLELRWIISRCETEFVQLGEFDCSTHMNLESFFVCCSL